MSDVVASIREYVRAQSQAPASDGLFTDDVDLFDYGYLDSFGIVGLIEMIERRYRVDLSGLDFYAEDARSIRRIARIVDARLNG